MARTFDLASGPNYTIQDVGTLAHISGGALTLMCLVNVTAGNNSCGLLSMHNSGGTTLTEFLVDGNQLFLAVDASSATGNDFSGGNTGVTVGSWWWCVARFAGGSAQKPRYSLKALGGSIAHVDSTFSLTQTAATATTIRLGDSDDRGNGSMAVWAAWLSDLSDADVDTATSLAAADIAALSPDALWLGNQSSATDLIDDETGNGADGTSINGTVGVGTDPPSYDYTLGGGGGTDHAGAVASSITATLTPAATHIRFGAIAASTVAMLTPTPHQIHGAAISSAVTASLTPAPTHVRPGAIAASATPALTPTATRIHPAAIAADVAPTLLPSTAGQQQAAITASTTATLTPTAQHTRAAAIAAAVTAALTAAVTAARAAAVSVLVHARLIPTPAGTITPPAFEFTTGTPQLGWRIDPPAPGWDTDQPHTGWRTGPPQIS